MKNMVTPVNGRKMGRGTDEVSCPTLDSVCLFDSDELHTREADMLHRLMAAELEALFRTEQ